MRSYACDLLPGQASPGVQTTANALDSRIQKWHPSAHQFRHALAEPNEVAGTPSAFIEQQRALRIDAGPKFKLLEWHQTPAKMIQLTTAVGCALAPVPTLVSLTETEMLDERLALAVSVFDI